MHGPYAAGECLACHEPHQSEFKALARAQSADLCLGCHDRPIEVAAGGRVVANIGAVLESSSFKHGPIREGRCDGCHWAHASPNANLLHQNFPPDFYQDYSESHYALCFQCHSSRIVLEERTLTLTRFRDGDRNLHFLHVTQEKGWSCRACHEVHASNRPFHIRESVRFGGWELPVDYQKTDTGGTCRSGCHKEASYVNS
jgi:predicted CXXCH cytochrome family protein